MDEDKTVEPVEILTFLGIEYDTFTMELSLLKDKIAEIEQMLSYLLNSKKVTLRELQSLIGQSNFTCQVVAP